MPVLEGMAARVRTFGFLLLAGAAFMAGGDVWRMMTEETALARVVALKESCWLIMVTPEGRRRTQQTGCAEAERAKAARPGEVSGIGRSNAAATLEFKTTNGQTVRIEPGATAFGLSRAKIGDVVRLAYDPANPRAVQTPASFKNLNSAKWAGIAGLVLLWLGGVLRKAGGASKGGLTELAEHLRRAAEQVSAENARGKGGFATLDKFATRTDPKPAAAESAVEATTVAANAVKSSAARSHASRLARAPARPLPKGTPRVVSPRRHGLLGLFR